ncbi:V-type proton ATPase subunit D 1 [Drosophila grimshawi]|uniref:GH22755 n=1 Tax=Drosophila grimshawi TaxID=7222 RepID=B4JWE1_DROGR|nr:V-type proton ATPase subunit D 1 [Drosophila grimshawi]EDV98279.1 GH22755 [Drosophila grimshawi]
MATTDKMQVFPSRANAVLMKQKILAAKRGMNLLKRKRDAIDMKLREIRTQMSDKEELVDDTMRTAIFSVAKANLLGTDLKPVIVADSRVATAFLRKRQQKIVGINLNYFELELNEQGAFPLAGLSCGGQQVQRVRKNFQQALQEIVSYASMEYTLRMLMQASRQTNMRVNALDCVVIPRLIKTSNYVDGELEEFEREDFYRLKRSQAKQLEAKIAFSELIKTKNMSPEELADYIQRAGLLHPAADVAFDLDVFEETSLEERMRRAFYQRHSQWRNTMRPAGSDASNDDIKEHTHLTRSAAQFMQRTIKRDPRSSRVSLFALPKRTEKPPSPSTSSSSNTD